MQSKLANGRIFTGERILTDHVVIVKGQTVLDIVKEDQASGVEPVIDLAGNTLVPGLIDLQVNGGGGVLFNDEQSEETIARIFAAHREFGTTAMMPTLISDTLLKTKKAICAIDGAIANSTDSILGIHLEGPFLNPARRGVHNSDFFKDLDDTAIDIIGSLQNGKTLLTLAPERTRPDVISRLVDAGVTVAAGHSDASYETVRKALDAGLSGFTHLFNAMSPLQGREPGVVGAALEDQNSWCGVIADGLHVHWAALKLAISAKPRGKVFLVTDAMSPVGTTDTEFELFGETVSRSQNSLTTPDGRLAGSMLDMMTAVRNAVQHLNVSWQEAIRMASLYPARFLEVDDHYGKIEPGSIANMLLIDDKLNVLETWVRGSSRCDGTADR